MPDAAGAATIVGPAALDAALEAIIAGRIVAMKGIGGYHLVVDATNDAAVAELRRRKARDDKPFAVMVESLAAARELCELDDEAAARPRLDPPPDRAGTSQPGHGLADGVAPGLPELGLMLPYSPCTTCCCAARVVRWS